MDYMNEALKEAKKACDKGEVPVGAVIVLNDKIIARAHNMRETKQSITAHAELLAIEKASKKLGTWRLENCDLYVTLEPCPMCSGAIIQSRIRSVYFGTFDPKAGACGSVLNLFDYKFNHFVQIHGPVDEEKCSKILKDFFKELRS